MSKGVATITKKDIDLSEAMQLTEKQLGILLQKTPAKYVHQRPAKGGGSWSYVTGGYVKKVLNLMFGFNWDFEIVDEMIQLEAKQVIVKGKLTCRYQDTTIVKMQYGRQDLKLRRDSGQPLDLGNDLKGAATDALKKCASELGVAADIYNAEEFREMKVVSQSDVDEVDEVADLRRLYDDTCHWMTTGQAETIKRVIDNQESVHYAKVRKEMQDIENEIEKQQP